MIHSQMNTDYLKHKLTRLDLNHENQMIGQDIILQEKIPT